MTATAVLTFIPKTKKTNTNNPFYFHIITTEQTFEFN